MLSDRAQRSVLLAAVLISIASLPPAGASVPLALGGIGLATWSLRGGGLRDGRFVAVAIVLAGVATLRHDLTRIPPISPLELATWVGVPILIGAAWALGRWGPDRLATGAVGLLVIGIGLAVMLAHHASTTGVDVYFGHIEGAEALAAGDDPYGRAVLIFDGRPDAEEGAVIAGYSYPPVTLVSYASAHLALGDARWLNLFAWTGVVGALAVRAWRSSESTSHLSMLVVASFAAWRLVVYTGWTEPLTILFLLVAGASWRRSTFASTVALGLALGTKQYMVLLLPLLLVAAPRLGRARVYGAIGVAAATLLPALVLSRDTFLDALVFRFIEGEYRSDTLSVPALFDGAGPGWLWILLGSLALVGTTWIVRRVADFPGLVAGSAVALGSFFVLTQALTNYWFLLAGMLVLGVLFTETDQPGVASADGDGLVGDEGGGERQVE